jgi:hypothetical protein
MIATSVAIAAMAMLAPGTSTGAEPPAAAAKAPVRSAADKATEEAEFLEFLGSTGAEDEAFVDFLARAAVERPVTREAPKQVTPPKTASRGESNER